MGSKLLTTIINNRYIKLFVLAGFIIAAFFDRVQYFNQTSKDIYAYERAILDLSNGKNLYKWTIESYSNPDDPNNHGFVYFPTILYVYAPLRVIGRNLGVSYTLLWKIPVLISDLAIGYFLFKKLKHENIFYISAALWLWFFNPYAYFRGGYTYFDPVPILFMLVSLYLLNKNNFLSGVTYALAVSFKTFPYLIFPVYLLNLISIEKRQPKDKKLFYQTEIFKFLLAGFLTAVAISIPFIGSAGDFVTYIKGVIFTQENRFVQGRPFLYYISYNYKIEFFRIIPFKVYTLLASFSGWLVLIFAYFKFKVRDKYIMSLIPFAGFYLFTPVLNRTYLIWFIPILILALYGLFKNKLKYMFFIALVGFYWFYSWYLIQWKDGFHIWHP